MSRMLGDKIREIRHLQKLTLSSLAEMTGLTASYLSQLERNIIDPSLASLRKISKALGVPMYRFLDDDDKEHILIRKGERKKLDLPNSSITYEFLSPMGIDKHSSGKLEVLYYELAPHSWSSEDYIVHDADEVIFVLEGTMEIYLGEEHFQMNEGDSALIKSHMPHRIYNGTDRVTKGVSSISPAVY